MNMLKGSAILACVLALPMIGSAAKLSQDTPKSGTINVIVQFNAAPDDEHVKKLLDKGAKLKKKFKSVDGVLVTVPADILSALETDPDIRYVTPDRSRGGKLEFANATTGANIARQYGYEGAGVGVAIIDSGIYLHPDLNEDGASRVVYSESFVPNDPSTNDGYGHGTHVAGIVAGNAAMSVGSTAKRTFRGIAPRAKLINLRVLDASGVGTDSAVIAAIDRAIELKSLYNIRVINRSVGRTVRDSFKVDPLCQAVERAGRAGIVVVVAAATMAVTKA
jgi:serine protease AprX